MSVRSKSTSKVETPGEGKGDGDELPEGWAISSVGDCFLDVRNGTTATQNKSGTGIPVSRIETIQNCRFDMSRVQYLDDVDDEFVEHFRYRPGDIAFSHINSFEHVGKTALYNGEPEVFIHGMNLLRLRLGHESIEPRFAQLFMQTKFFREEVRQRVGHAVNQVSINQRNLAEVPFVLPPLAEQRRIVAKLEALLSKVSTTQQRLSHLPTLLKRFRQSVLAAACSGRLTADWREENPTDDAESDFTPDYEIPAIPNAWKWHQIQQIGDVKSGKRLPKGRQLVAEDTGHIYLRAGNLKDGTVRCDGLLFVPTDVWPKIKNYVVAGGDVYITIVGACIGDAGVIPKHFSGANLTENAAKVCNLRGIASHFLASWLRSQHCQTIIQQNILSAAQGKLALFRIQQLPVPVPPLDEQHEIVRRVEKLFAFADQIESRLKQAQAHVDRLTQSLLAKAFRGELVPTEAELARQEGRSYESASELLERIRATKGDDAPTKRKRGKASKP